MLNNINRRKFVTSTAASAAGILIGSHLKGMAAPDREREEEEKPSAKSKYDIMKEVMKYRKIDTHAHIYFTDNSPGEQLDYGERLRIEKQVMCCNQRAFKVRKS